MKKKVVNVLLLILLLFFACFDVSAITPDPGIDTGTIKITGINSDDNVIIYPILETNYNSTSNTFSYEFSDFFGDANTLVSVFSDDEYLYPETVDDYLSMAQGDRNSFFSEMISLLYDPVLYDSAEPYISPHKLPVTISGSGDNAYATTTVTPGSYLVYIESSRDVYSLMIVNLEYTVSDGEWVLDVDNDGYKNVVAKSADYSISVKPVSSVGSDVQIYSTDILKPFYYRVDLSLPNWPNSYVGYDYNYTLNVNFSDHINFSDSSDIIAGNFDIVDTRILIDDEEIGGISLNGDSVTFAINESPGIPTLTFYFRVELNDSAASEVNTLTYHLSYNLPEWTGASPIVTDDVSVPIKSYTVLLHNYETGTSSALDGAVYELYRKDGTDQWVLLVTSSDIDADEFIVFPANFIDDDFDGFIFGGLSSGSYKIVQTKAPTGYKLASDVLFDISDDTVYTDDVYGDDIIQPIMYNSKIGSLPFTGGVGTTIFYIFGLIIIILSVFMILYYKRRKLSCN